jgi:hypothetical protein
MMGDHLESVLNATVEESLRKLSEARRTGNPIAIPPDDGKGYRPVAVKVHMDPTGDGDPELEVTPLMVDGRALPRRMDARSSFTPYFPLESVRRAFLENVTRAYAKTDADKSVFRQDRIASRHEASNVDAAQGRRIPTR